MRAMFHQLPNLKLIHRLLYRFDMTPGPLSLMIQSDSCPNYKKSHWFSIANVTLQLQMSNNPLVFQSSKPLNSLQSSFFIIQPSTFIILNHSTFNLHHSSLILYSLHSSFLHFVNFKLFRLFFILGFFKGFS